MKIDLDPKTERVLKKLMPIDEIQRRIQGLVQEWANEAIKNAYSKNKRFSDIINELDT